MIRVLANDGVNVGSDTTDGTFSVPNTPPLPAIGSPAHTKVFATGARIDFLGSGTDREDGLLPDQALSWSSDRDGVLGSGTALSKRDLSPGRHVITLTATDNDGASAQATIAIAVDGEQSVDIPTDHDLEQIEAFLSGDIPESSDEGGAQAEVEIEPGPANRSPLLAMGLIVAAALLGLVLMVPMLLRIVRRE
jgi:hypothetical protein